MPHFVRIPGVVQMVVEVKGGFIDPPSTPFEEIHARVRTGDGRGDGNESIPLNRRLGGSAFRGCGQ